MALWKSFEGNVFSGSHLDRAGNNRRDPDWLRGRLAAPEARFLPIWQLKAPIAASGTPHLLWLSRPEAEAVSALETPILLGVDDGGVPYFAFEASAAGDLAPLDGVARFEEVRTVAPAVERSEAALLAQARSLVDWHRRHGFCAVCGAPTRAHDGGYVRRCTDEGCGAQHFPRTDPVVIMLIHHGERCLLGRQKWFPEGFYSTLAGFMEPGESIEEAVRREVWEEAAIPVGDVGYHSSQPWPYPSSLMIGCIGTALHDRISVDDLELEDARWVDRATVREAVERVTARPVDPLSQDTKLEGVGTMGLKVPAPMAIAHQLMRTWAYE